MTTKDQPEDTTMARAKGKTAKFHFESPSSWDRIMRDAGVESREETKRKIGVLCDSSPYRRYTAVWQEAFNRARVEIENKMAMVELFG